MSSHLPDRADRINSWAKVKGGPVIAVIDMGTNSFHMIVCQASPNKDHFEVLAKIKEAVPFFRRSLTAHYIDETAMRACVRILRDMQKKAREKGASVIVATATSAVRESKNGEDCLRRIRQELKIDARMISGKEEARMIYLGVLSGLVHSSWANAAGLFPGSNRFCIVDIGGGSTELIVGDRDHIYFAESYKLGAARLTQRFFKKNSKGCVSREQIKALHEEVRGVLRPSSNGIANSGGFSLLLGTSGTIQALAKLDRASSGKPQAELSGFRITRERLKQIVSYLENAALKGEKPKGVSSDRNETILAGAIVLLETMRSLDVQEIAVCSQALREGVVVDRFLQTGWYDAGLLKHRDPRSHSVHNLLEKYGGGLAHAQHVAYLSQLFFQKTRGILHDYQEDEGHLLWSAAMLHDVGMFIGRNGHHKHSYYLIKHGGLLGHSEEEVSLIASIARYHRGSEPKITHEAWLELDVDSRKVVYDLACFLRLAEALDRSHRRVVKDFRLIVKNETMTVLLDADNNDNCRSEIWAFNEKKAFIEQHFQIKLEVLIDAAKDNTEKSARPTLEISRNNL